MDEPEGSLSGPFGETPPPPSRGTLGWKPSPLSDLRVLVRSGRKGLLKARLEGSRVGGSKGLVPWSRRIARVCPLGGWRKHLASISRFDEEGLQRWTEEIADGIWHGSELPFTLQVRLPVTKPKRRQEVIVEPRDFAENLVVLRVASAEYFSAAEILFKS